MNCLLDPRRLGPWLRGLALLGALANALAWGASLASAAPPKITRLSVHGFQIGATTRVLVQGTGLLPDPKLLLGVPIASQSVQGTPKADTVEFDVTLDKSVVPGVYNLRLSTHGGITGPEFVAIDALPQRPVATVATQVESLPVAIHGVLSGAIVQETRFTGHAGESIVIDALAKRFGSKLRPVVHLYDSHRRQIAWSLPTTQLAGDTRLSIKLPADDTYTVAVHDLAYGAATLSHYRLAIGQFDYVDQVYPPAVSRAGSTPLELVGKFGAGQTVKLDASSAAKSIQDSADAPLGDWQPVAWPATAGPIGLRPRIQLSNLTELAEGQTLDASRQLATLPIAVSGILAQPGETDAYHLDVAEGDKLRFELFADRLGSPIDATLELKNPQDARLAFIDDTLVVGADPSLDYTVAKGVSRLTVVVADAHRRGDANCIYRLVVTRTDVAHLEPDFKLGVFEDAHQLPPNGSKVFRVEAQRFNYDGPIRLTVEGLPPGFTAAAVEIPARATGTLVEIRRAAESADPNSASAGRIVIRGQSVDKTPPLTRAAEIFNHPLASLQPWLTYDLAVAAASAPAALAVSWSSESAEPPLFVGLDAKLPIHFQRGPGANGPLRLSLVTSQVPPLVNGQPNQVQLIRGSAVTIDIPLDPQVKAVSDALTLAEKALADANKKLPKEGTPDPKLVEEIAAATKKRDEAAAKLTEAESKLNPAYEYALLVPADLLAAPYDLAVKAELRSMDNLTVLREAFTTPRRFNIQPPIELALSGDFATKDKEPSVLLDPKTGATATVEGTVKRLGGFAGDVTLTLTGLPAGIVVPRVVLKPTEEKYQLQFKLPPTFAAPKIEAVQLSVTLAPETRRATILEKVEQPLPAIRVERPPVAAAVTPPAAAPAADKPPAAPPPSAAVPPAK